MPARTSAVELYECFQKPINIVNLRRIMLLLLRVHWSDADNHADLGQELGCLTYSDTEASPALHVILNYAYNYKDTSQFPAVIVSFADTQLTKNTVANYAGAAVDNSATFSAIPAKTMVVISHVHSSADVATAMAESTATFLVGVREPTMKRLDLRAFDVLGVSRVRPLEKMPAKYFSVEVSLSIDFNMAVTVNLEGHRLKKYGQEFTAAAASS